MNWIPVSERLPEKYQLVALVSVERFWSAPFDSYIYDCAYLDDSACAYHYWCIRGQRAVALNDYTHWMPLYPPPVTP